MPLETEKKAFETQWDYFSCLFLIPVSFQELHQIPLLEKMEMHSGIFFSWLAFITR